MKFLNRLERSLGRFAVPRITIYIVFLQSLAFVILMSMQSRSPEKAAEYLSRLVLIGSEVLHGEVWRVITFVVIPPITNPIFFFFAMYLLFLMGTALESHWGTFRYNVYLLVGWLATVAVAIVLPTMPASNGYLMGSIFTAFAFLYPDFQLMLFFIFPVKVKWLALLTWIGFFIQFCIGGWLDKFLVLAGTANFLLFFHRELWQRASGGHRRMLARAKSIRPVEETFNRCTTCGATEKSDPRMEFRYCPQCAGTPCYCILHIHAHAHIPRS
jgi:hypothetical protein